MRSWSVALFGSWLLCSGCVSAQDEFTFDVDEFERKAFELTGYVELEPEYAKANDSGALYQLLFYAIEPERDIERLTGTLELEAHVRQGIVSANLQMHSEVIWDYLGETQEHAVYEAYVSVQPNPGIAVDIGKKAMRWGKGYAWNPVAFVERAKDAGDPDLAREGYWIGMADWITRFEGPLQTVALTALVLPVTEEINLDFGDPGYNHLGAKLYLLYRDIDLDFMFLSQGSRGTQVGMDFSYNIAPNFEIHGEFAHFKDVVKRTVTADCRSGPPRIDHEVSYLLGTRYRTEEDITLLLEYYYNGRGNSESQQRQFYRCVHQAWESGDPALFDLLPVGRDIDRGPFSKPNPMRRYMSFRGWWEEPGDILYLTAALGVLYNLDDESFSVSPELTYEGFDDMELRLRGAMPIGDNLTEWGEKPNDYMIELQMRHYF
jgi:hypothetical protein